MSPLNISVKGEYALLAVFDLTEQRPGQPVTIASIAKRQKIPEKFLELILASLKQGGFVESRRGAEGGYLLARPAETIRLGDVVRHMEGSRASRHSSRRKTESPFAEVWREVEEAISGVLDHRTFAEVARAWRERQAQYVPTWDI